MDMFFIELLKWLALGFIGIFIGMFIILSMPPSAETTVTPEKRRNFNPTFPLGRERKIRQLADRIRSGQSSVIIGLFGREKTELLGYLRNEEPQQQGMLYGEQAAILIMKKLAAFDGFQRSGKTLQHKIHQGIPTVKIQITG